jgi:diaminohydroxyphosphoribosylaminopyrimidine deaminase / 5-amino-6-(5-phosphoribosylamino)uracil reductase
MTTDQQHMRRALRLARRGGAEVHPNPRVGCVLVRDDQVIAEGWHRRFGGPHAEVEALRRAGGGARGATAFVSLEPCSHHGKTPPCADALIEAGVARVVAAMRDPNPRVAGAGLARLEAAGVRVESGVLEAEARALNAAFLTLVEAGRAHVTLKAATTLDGKMADARGESKWITGLEARRWGHRLRRDHRVVLTGIGTVLADDPAMTVRHVRSGRRPPVRAVMDTEGRTPSSCQLVASARELPTLVLCAPEVTEVTRARLAPSGVEVLSVPRGEDGHLDPLAALSALARRDESPILLEAGGALSSSFLRAGLVDELALFMAPSILGCRDALPAFDLPGPRALGERLRLVDTRMRRVGEDWLLRARVAVSARSDGN